MKDFLSILCLGGSFTGRYLASHFPGCRVSFLSRSLPEGGPFRKAKPVAEKYDFILDTVPPVRGREGLFLPYYGLLQEYGLLDLPYVHISTTSVFGFSGAKASRMELLPHLDEASETRPDNPRAVLRQELEALIRRRFSSSRIVRAAGIYGPGRNLRLSLLNKDTRRMRRPDLLVNRIHVEDLCRIVLAVGGRLLSGEAVPEVLVATDGHPALNYEVYHWLALEFPEMRSLLAEDGLLADSEPSPVFGKILRSKYIEDFLGNLHFPDYRSGLRHCALEEERAS